MAFPVIACLFFRGQCALFITRDEKLELTLNVLLEVGRGRITYKYTFSQFTLMMFLFFMIFKVLFWSGTRELTHAYSRLYDKFTTLEDTLAG